MDIIILINWYNQAKMTFFCIGVSFITLSQLSHYCTFHMSHHGKSPKDCIHSMLATCLCIPCLQIILTLLVESDSCFRQIFCCDIEWKDLLIQIRAPMHQWIEKALYFLHAILQSFPQCILQIVAMYYHKQTNNVFLSISILLSILMIRSQCYIPVLLLCHF